MSAARVLADVAAALCAPERAVPAVLCAPSPAQRERRFAVHRNTFVAGLVDGLTASFPVTRMLLGDAFFRAMARECVLAAPPRSPVLIEYAQHFPAFVAEYGPAAGVPYVAAVARLEAMRVAAFSAADAEPLTPAAFAPWLADPSRLAALRLALHPAASCRRFDHAAVSLWRAHPANGAPDLDTLAAIDVDAREDALVTRPRWDVSVDPLPAGAIALLDALRDGAQLGDAFAAARADGDSIDDGALFGVLIRPGVIAGFLTSVE
ncbi:HvfC/BufC N-terminal domain-containing protein [Cognatilysobacter tabacisoli]|uniref:HvfC/BufC N-terminal domain-containing protein n=1 Tax=Cognatilysobacter tabacisoli TaxID=2315424 RepID=UPI000E6AFBB3|nr:DNA-binding domain-containing protein [Lysobacter tabacisoli]